MLWLCLSFPHLPVELRQPPDTGLVAIADRRGAQRVVTAANSGARAHGIANGMAITVAIARAPMLRVLERSPDQERRALKALANWSQQFSSEVCIDPDRWLLWIEIAKSLRYFDGLKRLTGIVEVEIGTLGYTAQLAVAPTLEAAALLAQEGLRHIVVHREKLPAALAPLPLKRLAWQEDIEEALAAAGLRTVGSVLGLPAAALARRFGPAFSDYLQRLIGQRPDPRPRCASARHYRRRYQCPYPIESIEGLLFPLRRLLQELQGYLRGRDQALQRLDVTLRHRDNAATSLELQLTRPQREAPQFFAVLREQLERTALPAPVTEIRLAADEFLEPDVQQFGLFDDSRRRASHWAQLLDKLRARLGEPALQQLGVADDHRPERAWTVNPQNPAIETDPDLARPLWLIEPQPLDDFPQILSPPERIEGGWWEGKDVRRDYYIARSADGARLWVYRDGITQRWYVHGLWG